VRQPGRDSPAQDAVRAHPGQHLDRQVFEEKTEAGRVVSGVRDDEDVGVTGLPLPRCDQSLEQIAQLAGGNGGGVVAGRQTQSVQRRGP
jgi:hypothetical protein